MIIRKQRSLFVTLMCLSFIGLPALHLAAGGSKSVETEKHTSVSSYLVVKEAGTGSENYLKQMFAGSVYSGFYGTGFTRKNGNIELDSQKTISGVIIRLQEVEAVEKLAVYMITLTIPAGSPAVPESPGSTVYTISFETDDLRNESGGIIAQPHQLAMIRAVGSSGKSEGIVRIRTITRKGSRYIAKVEVSSR